VSGADPLAIRGPRDQLGVGELLAQTGQVHHQVT
jgi:hypothetical protein